MTQLRQRNRLHPFSTLGWLHDEMGRAFERTPRPTRQWSPAFTLHETDLAFEARFAIPGADADTLNVSVEGEVLRVSGERRGVPEAADRAVTRERSTGKFSRALEFPAPVDPEHVQAAFQNGILHVTLPKAASARPHTIAIKFNDEE